MFKLGEYDEDEAREIADHLRDAGMKVEIRTFTVGHGVIHYLLEGRMSELKGEMDEEEYRQYEQALGVLRKVLAEGVTEEGFRERLLQELDPQLDEKRRRFSEIMAAGDQEQSASELFSDLMSTSDAEYFLETVMERNGIRIGEEVGSRLDDPILRIPTEEREHRLARTSTVFTVEPLAEVCIDEFSALLSEDLDEEFERRHPEEHLSLILLGRLISDLAEGPEGRLEMEAFAERCRLHMEHEGDLVDVDCSRAADELARSLEKNGIVKRRGESIRWRR